MLAAGPTAVIILADFGSDIQRYQQEFSRLAVPHPQRCPACAASGRLIGHGSYPRGACDQTQFFLIRVKRLLCTLCRHTISLLPSFCLPHRHYLAATIQGVLALRFQQNASWAAIRRCFLPAELPALSTCRGWVKTFGMAADRYVASLLQQLALWPLQPGKLELTLAALGAVPKGPEQLLAVVPHLGAWLRDNGLTLPTAGRTWLQTLARWGQTMKLVRLV